MAGARRTLARTLGPGLAVSQLWLTASTGYLLALLGAGARRPAGAGVGVGVGPGAGAAPGAGGERLPPAVAVLIPAHDEQAGVGATVRALLAQDFPRERLEVIVIADNCTDDTAGAARAAGATVWERDEPAARGKGQALGWALGRLRARRGPDGAGGAPGATMPEIVVIVDADCIASPNLCAVIAREMAGGTVQALQLGYEVANPDESPTAALRAAGFALKHVIRARGRARLGLSCGLFGSGMAFDRRLLEQVGWPTSVTEDTELHLRLVERGVIVAYAGDAAVRSPMPVTAAGAAAQQLRWESGNAQLARTRVWGLLARGLRRGDGQLLATAADTLLPPQSMLAAGSLGLGAASAGLGRRRLAALAALTLGGQAVYVLGGLAAAGAPAASFRALAHAPGFVLSRLGVLARVASGRGARTWVRTDRGG